MRKLNVSQYKLIFAKKLSTIKKQWQNKHRIKLRYFSQISEFWSSSTMLISQINLMKKAYSSMIHLTLKSMYQPNIQILILSSINWQKYNKMSIYLSVSLRKKRESILKIFGKSIKTFTLKIIAMKILRKSMKKIVSSKLTKKKLSRRKFWRKTLN